MGVYIEGTNKPETDGTIYQISYFTRDGYFITESYPIYRVIDLDLVRCEECAYRDTDECRWLEEERPNDDDFCSYGERRADGHI